MTYPKIQGNDIFEMVEGLHAYDDGATDSGIRNEAATREIDRYLKSLDNDARRAFWAEAGARYLAPDAVAEGYGLDDVVSLAEWAETMGWR